MQAAEQRDTSRILSLSALQYRQSLPYSDCNLKTDAHTATASPGSCETAPIKLEQINKSQNKTNKKKAAFSGITAFKETNY